MRRRNWREDYPSFAPGRRSAGERMRRRGGNGRAPSDLRSASRRERRTRRRLHFPRDPHGPPDADAGEELARHLLTHWPLCTYLLEGGQGDPGPSSLSSLVSRASRSGLSGRGASFFASATKRPSAACIFVHPGEVPRSNSFLSHVLHGQWDRCDESIRITQSRKPSQARDCSSSSSS
jgi:hypothetical protein